MTVTLRQVEKIQSFSWSIALSDQNARKIESTLISKLGRYSQVNVEMNGNKLQIIAPCLLKMENTQRSEKTTKTVYLQFLQPILQETSESPVSLEEPEEAEEPEQPFEIDMTIRLKEIANSTNAVAERIAKYAAENETEQEDDRISMLSFITDHMDGDIELPINDLVDIHIDKIKRNSAVIVDLLEDAGHGVRTATQIAVVGSAVAVLVASLSASLTIRRIWIAVGAFVSAPFVVYGTIYVID